VKEQLRMRAFLISILSVILVGCAYSTAFAPNAAQVQTKPTAFKAGTQHARSTGTQPHPSAHFGKKNNGVANAAMHPFAGKIERLPSRRLDQADPMTVKAKAAIAGMMENPASAEFSEMKRAIKNLLDEPLDTICGHVRGKNASGVDTGDMPFLYIIRDDEAYLVDGSSPMAETVHSIVCK